MFIIQKNPKLQQHNLQLYLPVIRLSLREGGDCMNAKMKACFTPHTMMHSLFGLGLGILLTALVPGLSMIWLGLVLMVVAVAADMMRK